MTTTRYYVARPATAEFGVRVRGWYRNKQTATAMANQMYENGITAPLVIAAPSSNDAIKKAIRCYNRELTTHQAADPRFC